MRHVVKHLVGVSFLFLVTLAGTGQAQPREATAIRVEGIISPATASYISRAIDESEQRGAPFLIIRLDTPGGLLDATQDIVRAMLASPVPIVVYVSPQGASAGSAGVFITLAAHVAVMAPATNIGAATPVQQGGGSDMDDSVREKMISYAESYIETIAAERGRNVEWARSAVRDGASITADEAEAMNVIDFIAGTESDLLDMLHGREIDDDRTLDTEDVRVVEVPMTIVESFFQTLFRPELIFILMLVAIYGIIGELGNPGAIFPGLVGVTALVLLLYTMAVLPLNLVGFALIGIAVALLVTELFVPSYGILTLAGAGAFVAGSMLIFDDVSPVFELSLAVVLPATVVTVLFVLFAVGAGVTAQLAPVRMGTETMIGQTVDALTPIDENGGKVFIEGEIWNAVSDEPVEEGQPVRVEAVKGLTLEVKPERT